MEPDGIGSDRGYGWLHQVLASTCFHGTLIQPPPHPEEARRAVSKGGMHRRCCPSFETPRYARLLRMRLSVNQLPMKVSTRPCASPGDSVVMALRRPTTVGCRRSRSKAPPADPPRPASNP